jgi:putative transposase
VYHVINRGNARNEVFHKEDDYAAFVKLMLDARERLPMRLAARGGLRRNELWE